MWLNRQRRAMTLGLLALMDASSAGAQLLGRNPVGTVLGEVDRIRAQVVATTAHVAEGVTGEALALADKRLDRLGALVRDHKNLLEMTDLGPSVRGEIIAIDPDAATLEKIRQAGFTIVSDERIEGLEIRSVTLRTPRGLAVNKAMRSLRDIAPDGEFTPNHLHLQSGSALSSNSAGTALASGGSGNARIGIVDGGVAAHPSLSGVEQRGFVTGAPLASAHGTAVASLAAGRGSMRGAAPGAGLLIADVYGSDPKGGNAVAIARALGFMAQRKVKVVAMSLVGPPNPLVAKAIGQVMARGISVVAAVGNDGPAAPPAFPASYNGVVAVTGVDGKDRPLVEAGRSLHLDFAAPGADMSAASPDGGLRAVRGTSYAVPLVAGRLALSSLSELRVEARDLGPKGPDKFYGHGLICGECRIPARKKLR